MMKNYTTTNDFWESLGTSATQKEKEEWKKIVGEPVYIYGAEKGKTTMFTTKEGYLKKKLEVSKLISRKLKATNAKKRLEKENA